MLWRVADAVYMQKLNTKILNFRSGVSYLDVFLLRTNFDGAECAKLSNFSCRLRFLPSTLIKDHSKKIQVNQDEHSFIKNLKPFPFCRVIIIVKLPPQENPGS